MHFYFYFFGDKDANATFCKSNSCVSGLDFEIVQPWVNQIF